MDKVTWFGLNTGISVRTYPHVIYRVAQKVVHFQHTISLKPFNIKWNGFHRNVPWVSRNKDWIAVLMRLLSMCKLASVLLWPSCIKTTTFYFILNGSKDMVCWKMCNFFGPPCILGWPQNREFSFRHISSGCVDMLQWTNVQLSYHCIVWSLVYQLKQAGRRENRV